MRAPKSMGDITVADQPVICSVSSFLLFSDLFIIRKTSYVGRHLLYDGEFHLLQLRHY